MFTLSSFTPSLKLLAAGALLALQACNPEDLATGDPDPSDFSENSQLAVTSDGSASYAVLEDSFERDDLLSDPDINQLIGYRGFIWDFGSPVLGHRGNKVEAMILDQNDGWGDAAHGDRALYMYGRKGRSIHNVYLITHTYNLKNVDELLLEFSYMSFGINDEADCRRGVEEYLKLEICMDTPENCGVGASLNSHQLNHGRWESLFTHSPKDGSDHVFNGNNHEQDDWKRASILLDVTNFTEKENVTFRFNARMTDGLKKDDPRHRLFDDAVAIDNLKVTATDFFDESDPVEPPEGGGSGGDPSDGPIFEPPVVDPEEECLEQGGIYVGEGVCIIDTEF